MIRDTLRGLAYILGVFAVVGVITFGLNHVCKSYPVLMLPIAIFIVVLPMSWQLGVTIREMKEAKNKKRVPK